MDFAGKIHARGHPRRACGLAFFLIVRARGAKSRISFPASFWKSLTKTFAFVPFLIAADSAFFLPEPVDKRAKTWYDKSI